MMSEKTPPQLLDKPKAVADAADFQLFGTTAIIDSEELWIKAREKRKAASHLYGQAEKHFEMIKKPHKDVLKDIANEEKEVLAPLDTGFESIDHKILAYEQELIRQRAEIQRQMEAEAKARVLEDQENEALRLEREGHPEEAAKVRARTPFVPPVMLPTWNFLLQGEGRTEVWRAEVVDLMALVKAVAAGEQPLALLQANMTPLNAMAKASKHTMNIPGVKASQSWTITQR